MRVLLVDDHALFGEGLRNLLVAHGFEVVGLARDGHEALAAARALRPEAILMDIQMPVCDGLTATRLIKAEMPEIKIVMLTVSEGDQELFQAIKNGASGYLTKNLESKRFLDLLSMLSEGEIPLSRGLAARILKEFADQANRLQTPLPNPGTQAAELTPRQSSVLTLVARGLTYRQVGEELCMTERTVKYHMGEILKTLHLQSRAQAIAYAASGGMITSEAPQQAGD